MPIERSSILRELLREPPREMVGGWRAAPVFLPRGEGRAIRLPGDGTNKAARRELGRLIAPRRLAS